MINLFGPNSANATATRPPDDTKTATLDMWFKDASGANTFDGTVVDASWYNTLTAQLRTIITESGVQPLTPGGDDLSDDALLARAIILLATTNNTGLVSNATFVNTINRYATTAQMMAEFANFVPGAQDGPTIQVQHLTPGPGVGTLTITNGYTPGAMLLVRNGVMLTPGVDFNDTSSPNITLTQASGQGDVFDAYIFQAFSVANAVEKSGDIMAGPLALAAGSTSATPAVNDSSTDVATTAFANPGAVMANPGYHKLPSGWIMQTGVTAVTAGTQVQVTLPEPWPSGLTFDPVVSPISSGTATCSAWGAGVSSTKITVAASVTGNVRWAVYGY